MIESRLKKMRYSVTLKISLEVKKNHWSRKRMRREGSQTCAGYLSRIFGDQEMYAWKSSWRKHARELLDRRKPRKQ